MGFGWTKMTEHSLFPFERPLKCQNASRLELDDGVGVVQLEGLVLAGCAWCRDRGKEAFGEGVWHQYQMAPSAPALTPRDAGYDAP